jgi:serine/threonine protein kinase
MAGGAESVPRCIGRYILHGEIAAGGMATVHFGRLVGPAGFSRAVAIKRLHPQFARDPEFVAMFIDEARLAARIFHPNVVPTLDVVAIDAELFLVMEYVRGAPLSQLIRAACIAGTRIPPRVVASIACGMLHGLHAAHEAKDEMGEPLEIVHRDVSPQNVLVDVDGVARVLDFGVAKATGRAQTTRSGQLKGKLSYMAPEQLRGARATRQSDVYGASIVLWEALTGARLFKSDSEATVFSKVLEGMVPPPSALVPGLPPALDEVVLRGAASDPAARYASARDMAHELEAAIACAPSREVGEWVALHAAEELGELAARIAEIERSSGSLPTLESLAGPPRIPAEPLTSAAGPLAQARARAATAGDGDAQREPVTTAVPKRARDARDETGTDRGPRRGKVIAGFMIAFATAGTLGAGGFIRPGANLESVRERESVAPAPSLTTLSARGNLLGGAAPAPAGASSEPAPPAREDAAVALDAPARPKGSPAPRTGSVPRKGPSCDPPSTTDERGHVHFKPECF